LPALVAAARAAEGVYAFAEALRLYERALALWDRVPDADDLISGDRVWLLQRTAEVNVLLGSYQRAIEFGRAAIAALAASADPNPARSGYLHERLRWFLWEAGDRRAAAEAVQEALRLIPPDPPTPGRARALAQLAGVELHAGRMREAGEAARQAIEVARAAGSPGEEALGLGVLGWSQAAQGDVDGGVATYRKGLEIAIELEGVEGIALGYAELARLYDAVGRTDESLAAAREGFEVARRLGLERTYGGIMLGHAAKALIDAGRWGEAATTLAQGLARGPAGRPAIWLRAQQARLDVNQGRPEAAAEQLRIARAIDQELGGTHYRAVILAGLAEIAVWSGNVADVRAAADEGWTLLRDDVPPDPALAWLATLIVRAEADAAERARARRDEAGLAEARARAGAVAERLARFESGRSARGAGAPPTGRIVALMALFRAELGRLEGVVDPGAWATVAAAWDAIGRPYPAAYARLREAEAHLGGRGSRADAEAALRSSHQVARRLGAEPLRREVELLARQARLELGEQTTAESTPEIESSPTAGLGFTAREDEVLRLVAGGWSNQQIADHLFISRKTASVHVSNILGKLGVSTRVEAAAIAHRLGLAKDAPPPPGSE
jgi:DNA-binding CsgD family transcriptional regulator/tetratricopeptide (TPR) repeat protein